MLNDATVLFTECHGHYIRGVRVAVRERTETEHGEDWWDKGVLANVTPDQRQQLERLAYIQSPDSLEDLLDAPHFGPIVCGSKLFLDYIGDSLTTFRKFRQLNRIRNEWAHVRMDRTSTARVVQSITVMEDILSLLRRREALEINRIREDYSTQPLASTSDVEKLPEEDDMEAIEDFEYDLPSDERHFDPMALWAQLHSYLELDTKVEPIEGNPDAQRITVSVTNHSPKTPDDPEVHFKNVSVTIQPDHWGHGHHISGYTLSPGDTTSFEIEMPVPQMASTEFELQASIDWNRLSFMKRSHGLPADVVRPILDELLASFEALDVKEFLERVLDSIAEIDSNMTMQDAAELRNDLKRFLEEIGEKVNGVGDIMRQFLLNRNTRPGSHFRDVAEFLNGLSAKISSLDEAISQTDLDLINQAKHELEQSQLAIMRLENVIKAIAGRSP